MQYLLLIYSGEERPEVEPEVEQAMLKRWFDYTEWLKAQGVFLGGEALEPTATATTLRKKADGEVVLTDGPFAETKEALGGFYLVECRDLDHALEVAAPCPVTEYGSLEVRPIWSYEPGPDA